MTVRVSNILFVLCVLTLITASGIMLWGSNVRGWDIEWYWATAPVWVPLAVIGAIFVLYQWDRGLLPWQK